LGGLDVLINNAGIAGPTAPVENMDPDEWEKVMQVDLTGTFNATRLAIPHLKKSQAGVIINMSSVAGRFGYANRMPLLHREVGADRASPRHFLSNWVNTGFAPTLSCRARSMGLASKGCLRAGRR
jgi:NAD(P)-dependent dehydrogenase (short-subunit alcohol dehydrogenase family)